jgi:hypothetical protein
MVLKHLNGMFGNVNQPQLILNQPIYTHIVICNQHLSQDIMQGSHWLFDPTSEIKFRKHHTFMLIDKQCGIKNSSMKSKAHGITVITIKSKE